MKNLIKALQENFCFQITYFASYIPSMKVLKNASTILCTEIQDDTFNIVTNSHFTLENIDEQIQAIINIFQQKHLPFSWWIGPNDFPYDLKERLLTKGFIAKENDYGMYLNIENYKFPAIDNKLHIKQVTNVQSLKEFTDIHVKAFGNPEAFDIIFSKIPSLAYQGKAPYRFYTGYHNKKAITTGVLVFHANVVGIYFIVTLPEERRKGYATEMMYHLLKIAKEEKQKIMILQASEEGKKVYEKMGFKKCCIFQEMTLKTKSTLRHSE